MKRIDITTRGRAHVFLTTLAALLSLTVALLAGAGPVSARENGLLDATCTTPSSSSTTYSPPLTNTPQLSTTSSSWQLGPCVSASVPGLTSGSHSDTGTLRSRSCLELLSSGAVTLVFNWNTGATSTMSLNRTTTVVGAVMIVTMTGTVTSGLFAGDTVVITLASPATDVLLCTAGLGTVSSLYSTVVMEVTSV
ncbi:hypothetical protein [Streptomyces atroolivaceus]|uniref:hypothetical protein n=1 Tax=Streptomyces atroolivaceus TaxID=66869 RepID=UPI0037976137